MTKLFLDDCRSAPDSTWIVVRNYDQFVAFIEKHGVPDVISFDHDLGAEHYPKCTADLEKEIDYSKYTEKTGYDCAKWLVANYSLPESCVVHSMNPVGSKNIKFVLENARRWKQVIGE